MSCIFKIFKSKKVPERRPSFAIRLSDPLPNKYEELVQYETFLRIHMNRLNRRYETVSKNLIHSRNQNNMPGILACMKERKNIESEFERIKQRLKEVLEKRRQFEDIPSSKTPTLMLKVVHNPLVSK
jgi:DNA repair exonuclease SbcCD ATPase subunit